MEPRRPQVDRNERDRRDPAGDLRGLQRLRDRIEAATREIERLRAENAALAARLATFEGGEASPLAAAFEGGDDPEALRAKIQGFIAAIDEVLREPTAPESAPEPPPEA